MKKERNILVLPQFKDVSGQEYKFVLLGSDTAADNFDKAINPSKLSGEYEKDRLKVQTILDENKGMPEVFFNGKAVYPSKIASELKRCVKRDSLDKISCKLAKFLCNFFEIEYTGKEALADAYGGSATRMIQEEAKVIAQSRYTRPADLYRIMEKAGVVSLVWRERRRNQ